MASGSAPQSQEFVVRAPKNTNRTYGIIKFNPNNKVDFSTAESVRIERENNLKDYKAAYDMEKEPKFGAGSEFGREEREEARRKKYGIHRRRYNVHDQPWILKLGSGKSARKFKGTKEGGILENASYYIFTQCADGAFDAFPVQDWHSFNPAIKYNHLSIDEAEEEYTRRDKTLNYFNIMVKKRVNPNAVDEREDESGEQGGKKKGKKGKGLVLTDMDEWANSSDENEADSDEERTRDSDDGVKEKGKKGGKQKKKTKKDHKTNSGDEAVEESDDADEGREVDYMTDTDSEDEDMYGDAGRNKLDKYKQTGVEDEESLKKIIESGDEEEEEAEKEGSGDEASGGESANKGSDSSSGSSSDSDPDQDTTSALFMPKKEGAEGKKDKKDKDKKKKKKGKGKKRRNSESSATSRSATPTSHVTSRSATPTQQVEKKEAESHVAKRAKMETPPVTGTEGLTEDMVRRYLTRKPMTTADLVKKFKNVGLTKDALVLSITEILKRLSPEQKKIDGKLYLWLKKTD